MEKPMHYTVYKITNKIDGKIYIGSHKTENLNDEYMGSGKYLKHAQEKYGMDNFVKEILFVYDTPDLMYSKEAELVNEEFIATVNTYNLKVGGFGGFDYINHLGKNNYGGNGKNGKKNLDKARGRSRSLEECMKTSETMKKSYASGNLQNPFQGKKHSDETKRLIGEKMTELQSGSKNSQHGTMWITDGSRSLKIRKEEEIPSGWRKGRKIIGDKL